MPSGRLVRILSWYLRAGLFLLPLAYSWGTYDHYVLPDIWFPVSYSVPNGPASQGLALYVPGSGIYWMSSLQVQLAGPCS